MDANSLIVAADVPDGLRFIDLLRELSGLVRRVKIGHELSGAMGVPSACRMAREFGFKPMIDTKLYDTPETMARTTAVFAVQNIPMFTVAVVAGGRGLTRVVAEKGGSLAIGVPVLSSFREVEDAGLIFRSSLEAAYLRFARMAVDAGLDGITVPAWAFSIIDNYRDLDPLERFALGVRPQWYPDRGGHTQSITPEDAISQGATYLVVGRPVTSPLPGTTPREAAKRFLTE